MAIIPILLFTQTAVIANAVDSEFLQIVGNLVQTNSKQLWLTHLPNEKNYALVATTKIQHKEAVLVMDPNFVLCSFQVFQLSQQIQDFPQEVKLIIRILYQKYQKEKRSFVQRYFDLFPQTSQCFGTWSLQQMNYLRSKQAFQRDMAYPIFIDQNFQKFMKIFLEQDLNQEIKKVQNWRWAACMVTSRSMKIPKKLWNDLKKVKVVQLDENREGSAISPLIDILNHHPLPLQLRENIFSPLVVDNGRLYVQADRSFKPYQEFVFSYSQFSNNDLITIYGFVIEKNLDDVIYLTMNKVDRCKGRDLGGGQCRFPLKMFEINKDVVNQFRKLGYDGIESVLNYRQILINTPFKTSLRELRREISSISDQHYRVVQNYWISEHCSYHQHLKLVDREIIKKLIEISTTDKSEIFVVPDVQESGVAEEESKVNEDNTTIFEEGSKEVR